MAYIIPLEGFEGREIALHPAGFFSGPKLLVNGHAPEKGPRRNQYQLYRNDGKPVTLELRNAFADSIPKVLLDGKAIKVVEPLKWYQWLWSGLPLLMLVQGGALGGLCGAVALYTNARMFREDLRGWMKYLVTGLISVLSFLAYLLLSFIFLSLVRGG